MIYTIKFYTAVDFPSPLTICGLLSRNSPRLAPLVAQKTIVQAVVYLEQHPVREVRARSIKCIVSLPLQGYVVRVCTVCGFRMLVMSFRLPLRSSHVLVPAMRKILDCVSHDCAAQRQCTMHCIPTNIYVVHITTK